MGDKIGVAATEKKPNTSERESELAAEVARLKLQLAGHTPIGKLKF